ncbi:MAG: translesion error-prone DNA polymerase V autoproteolytic subunit [Candidatus Methanomethylicaceae archaeon]
MVSEKGLYVTEIYQLEQQSKVELPLAIIRVPAGFPYPGADFIDREIDLNEFLIKHPSATYLMRVQGESMIEAGIHDGDILIVDCALTWRDKDVVIAVIDGELVVKRIKVSKKTLYLVPENEAFQPIQITPEMNFEVRGVVTHVIHPLR